MGKIFYTGKNYDILFYINIYIYIYIKNKSKYVCILKIINIYLFNIKYKYCLYFR
jgi:hypothetical protein